MKYFKRTRGNYQRDFVYNLLLERGIVGLHWEEDDVKRYYYPDEECLIYGELLNNIEEGRKLFEKHIKNNNKILIVVDPDVDGFTSSALMYNYLKEIFNGEENISYLLPDGKEHGLATKMDFFLSSKKADLIIIPDAASNDHEQLKELKNYGYDILVLDHHIFDYYDENAIIINNQGGDYENRCLSGVGVVYKFLKYYEQFNSINIADNFLDLVATGQTGDMMNLNTLENRYITDKGFRHFNNNGLVEILKVQESRIKHSPPTQMDISFYLVPLLNALIRVGSPIEKETLFQALTNGSKKIQSTKRGCKDEFETYATQNARNCVNARNRQNRIKEKSIELLSIQIEENCLEDNKIFILNADEIDAPNTLTGLIAMGISAKYKRPVMLGRTTDDGVYLKGSIRGVNGSELSDFRQFLLDSNLMEYVEGHSQAAGFGIKIKNVERLYDYANKKLKDINFHEGFYEIDFIQSASFPSLGELINDINNHSDLFGQGNDEPRILVTDIPISTISFIGKGGDTIKMKYNGIEFVKFKDLELAETLSKEMSSNPNQLITLIGKAARNEWNGNITPQILVDDLMVCKDDF